MKYYIKNLSYRDFTLLFSDYLFFNFFEGCKNIYVAYRGIQRNILNSNDLGVILNILDEKNIWNYNPIHFQEIKFSYNKDYHIFDFLTQEETK